MFAFFCLSDPEKVSIIEGVHQFISLMQPVELDQYFVIKGIQSTADMVELYLEEKETIPLECKGHQVLQLSKAASKSRKAAVQHETWYFLYKK